jgi:hypothetical protein
MKPREPRRKVMLRARMRIGAAWRDACILDLSSRGLMIQAKEPPRGGSYIEIRRGRHIIVARVMWTNDGRCGLRTQDALVPDAIIAEPDEAHGPAPLTRERRVTRAPPRAIAHEQSRWRSRAIEFSFVAIIGAMCGTFAYGAVSAALAQPLMAVERVLSGEANG